MTDTSSADRARGFRVPSAQNNAPPTTVQTVPSMDRYHTLRLDSNSVNALHQRRVAASLTAPHAESINTDNRSRVTPKGLD